MKKKLYEIETNRHFKNVEAFYKHCEKFCEKHGISLDMWMDSFEQFVNPIQKSNSRTSTEICKMQPYEHQIFLRDNYNFIMEFDFFGEKDGFGYLYIVEYDR